MSEKEELKRLERKIEGISKQLRQLQTTVIGVTSHKVKRLEERRREAEKTEKKFEILIYYRSLAMGLTLGIIGNMFASYLMKVLEIFIPPVGWILITFLALAGILGLVWSFDRKIKKLSKETFSS